MPQRRQQHCTPDGPKAFSTCSCAEHLRDDDRDGHVQRQRDRQVLARGARQQRRPPGGPLGVPQTPAAGAPRLRGAQWRRARAHAQQHDVWQHAGQAVDGRLQVALVPAQVDEAQHLVQCRIGRIAISINAYDGASAFCSNTFSDTLAPCFSLVSSVQTQLRFHLSGFPSHKPEDFASKHAYPHAQRALCEAAAISAGVSAATPL